MFSKRRCLEEVFEGGCLGGGEGEVFFWGGGGGV